MPTPEFIVVGHMTRDEHADGTFTLGGAVSFASIAARNLGYRVGILTSAADDFPERELLDGIEIVRVPALTTTTFRNVYTGTKRQQYVRDIAENLTVADIPSEWLETKIALLGPLNAEVEADMVRAFADETLVAVAPQGWMRQWDETGRVKPRDWTEAPDILPHADVLILSEEDLGGHPERLTAYAELAPLVALTRGDKGVSIYRKGEPALHVPAFSTQIVDPTGAGDSFAAGFLICLHETNDPLQAARFGNATAALAIASKGAATMPTREQVESKLKGKS
jgi:sugar/nucleoside kinase (ribokinase family)